jgi:hypothetical protein
MEQVTETFEKKDDLVNDIIKLQEEYYTNNTKNFFFKKDQKYDCANVISQTIDITLLFKKTLYILREGEVYFDYVFFKTYIHPEIFDTFLDYVNTISFEYIDTVEKYNLHLNLNTLSISAFERYWGLIKQILQKYPVNGNKMQKTYIYYTPSVVDQIIRILNPFIVHIKDKIVFYSKAESPEKIKKITT